MTGLIDRAQQRGLVERITAPHDRRAVHVRLTGEGRRLAEQIAAQANAALSGLLAALPGRDRARLSALAGTVVRQHAASRGVDLDPRTPSLRPGTLSREARSGHRPVDP